jgi:oxygen-independent coproporphyrinogen-3 oxidase
MSSKINQPGGIYIHIPFCVRKCPYCDFYSITDLSLKSRFLQALNREMEIVELDTFVFDTLYIGGGTPSVLNPDAIEQIIKAVFGHFDFLPDAEVTIEVNPGTVSFEQFRDYFKAGVNRLNIGVQSFQEGNLNFLGRIHSVEDAYLAYGWVRQAGFDNIGMDLIYGLPEQTKANWRFDLEHAVQMRPDHLSCYMLTCEPDTPLHQDLKRDRFQLLSETKVRDLFDLTLDYLESHGYVQYEISNFARLTDTTFPSPVSRHNIKYWSLTPYVGFGPSAHSFIEPQRYWNFSDIKKYIREIEAGRLPIEEKEVLSTQQLMMEAIYLGLRTINGIDLAEFNQRFKVDFLQTFESTINDLEKNGLLRIARGHCALTRKGLSLLDSITSNLTSLEFTGR